MHEHAWGVIGLDASLMNRFGPWEFLEKLQTDFWIKHMTRHDHRIRTSMLWKHTGSWLQRHGGPVDTEEDSGNPFEGFRRKLHMRSRWVSAEADLLATGCPLAPWEPQLRLHPMQLSLITSSQQAHCDDAIPLEACAGYPGRLSSHQTYIFSFIFFPGVDYSLRNHWFD